MIAEPNDDRLRRIVEAVARSVDPSKLARELDALAGAIAPIAAPPAPAGFAAPSASTRPSDALLGMLVLADLLDDSILQARAGDKEYALRVLFTSAGEALATEIGLTFCSALNLYFRAPMDEEVKMRVGLETSRLYYRFASERGLETALVAQASPLLAALLSGELERVRFEPVDGAKVFDSQAHERTADSDSASARILGAAGFACRVTATNMLRARALVRT